MERFADAHLQGRIKFQTEVLRIYRSEKGLWLVDTEDIGDDTKEPVRNVLKFSRIVLCTGVCAAEYYPLYISTILQPLTYGYY